MRGQRDHRGRWRPLGAFGDRRDGQERQDEHGEGDPPMPGGPGTDLMLIQPGQALLTWKFSPRSSGFQRS